MDRFFAFIESHSLFPDLSNSLDWLFSENKFNDSFWNSTRKATLSNQIRNEVFPKPGFFQTKSKEASYPAKNAHVEPPFALFTGDALCVDLIRHMRNGIAHGHSTCYTDNDTHYITLEDFYYSAQTAYIVIPILDIATLHKLYVEVSNQH